MRIATRTAGVATAALLSTALAAWEPAPGDIGVTSAALDDQQLEIRDTIGRESGRLPRLAIPAFLGTGTEAELRTAATALADVLWKDMEFEREYQMITQTGAAQIPAAPVETLPYDLWKQVSADEVLVGGVRRAGATLQVDVRVMSIGRRVPTFARTYPCPVSAKGLRRCAHTIADELHKERFGLDGVARTRFAFTSDRDGERQNGPVADRAVKEIYISDYDGHGAMRVSVRGSLNIAPTWAPDGRAIAYQSYQSNFSDFYVQKLDEVQLQLARPGRGSDRVQNYLPAWSPDGSRMAFASSRDGNFEIYVVNVDGTDMRRLTSNPADDNSPAWHPNGTQIAFTSDRTGRNQIYMMSADGGPASQITNEPGNADRPTWSTLDYLVYSTEVPGNRVQIKRIKPGSREVVQLTSGPGSNESPTVAPNGRHIAFVSNRWGGKEQIAVMDIDGQNIRQLTFTGKNTFPRWSHR